MMNQSTYIQRNLSSSSVQPLPQPVPNNPPDNLPAEACQPSDENNHEEADDKINERVEMAERVDAK